MKKILCLVGFGCLFLFSKGQTFFSEYLPGQYLDMSAPALVRCPDGNYMGISDLYTDSLLVVYKMIIYENYLHHQLLKRLYKKKNFK